MLDLKLYGYTETPPDGLLPGRVTAVHKARYELMTPLGPRFCRLKTGAYYGEGGEPLPAVGDFVLFQTAAGGDGQILKTLPRKTQFIRRDPYAGEQVIAANMDYVFIMTSLNRDFNINRIERYLALARQSGAVPVVVLTKADLADDVAAKVIAAQTAAKDTDIVPISVVTGAGMDRLNEFLKPGKTAVFIGMSGVGKSSLLNALMGQTVMAAGAIREDDGRGRHTTTHRQLFTLPSGAMVIDTPGMRSLGMWDAEEGVSETFHDVEVLLGGCRFSDCRHQTEPGCAIREAVGSGRLSEARWENYNTLKREARYTVDKTSAMREKWARNKSIAKWNKQMKKEIW
ncbi:MAG: ribosome small subunit-dependent GTPase A [Oscillospiraceae bacterium]|nr:ribosome small subunit-dependent GTPase A [Oscillospiraceae bacterium]